MYGSHGEIRAPFQPSELEGSLETSHRYKKNGKIPYLDDKHIYNTREVAVLLVVKNWVSVLDGVHKEFWILPTLAVMKSFPLEMRDNFLF